MGTYLTKYPLDSLRIEPSIHVDPNLYVVYLIRDPRDIICSRHGKDNDTYWVGLKYWNLFLPVCRRLRKHERFVPLKYEKFVEHPNAVQDVLERALPLGERKHHFGDYHNHAEVSDDAEDALGDVRPISAESVGRWEDHRPRVAGQIELHGDITEDLLALGYEQTRGWTSELAGTDPFLEGSHYEEFANEKEISSLRAGRYREAAKRVAENVIGKRILRQSCESAA
ncbi:hypothetical protein [Salinibacter altiplanensis]|uniref:hypothetical protein n=1 Tax=Salinibacter altiplanensis TaxID=1803181 RepID=UPI001300110C|nr:hypothetical protein [Salinibacter altiplanensis]